MSEPTAEQKQSIDYARFTMQTGIDLLATMVTCWRGEQDDHRSVCGKVHCQYEPIDAFFAVLEQLRAMDIESGQSGTPMEVRLVAAYGVNVVSSMLISSLVAELMHDDKYRSQAAIGLEKIGTTLPDLFAEAMKAAEDAIEEESDEH